jgi:hypothetical protein
MTCRVANGDVYVVDGACWEVIASDVDEDGKLRRGRGEKTAREIAAGCIPIPKYSLTSTMYYMECDFVSMTEK